MLLIKVFTFYAGKYKKYQPFTSKVTKQILKQYKKIKYVPSNISHLQLINEKIDYVLTVFGSVQFEYPYYNIPVLTASQNIPSIDYDFCIHSKNAKELKTKILNLKKNKFKIQKDEIKEFYYMNFIYHNQNIVYPLYNEFFKKYKKWDLYWSELFYEFWCNNFSYNQHRKILKVIKNFTLSKDLTINLGHLNEKNN